MTVYMYDSTEDMFEAIQRGKEKAKSMMTEAQWKLTDGEEHYAMEIEVEGGEANIVAVRILSHLECEARAMERVADLTEYESDIAQEIIEESFYEVDFFNDPNNPISYGYLPCESWDSCYYPDVPDLHDRHALMLLEISKEEFLALRAIKCNYSRITESRKAYEVCQRWITDVWLPRQVQK